MSLLRRARTEEPDTTTLRCPRDETPLTKQVVDGVTIDRCGQCAGTWFDEGELRRVTQERKIEREATRERIVPLLSDFPCPRCNGNCQLSYIEEVQVDTCTGCKGVWLDAGEVEEARRQVEVNRILADAGPGFRRFLSRL